MDFKSALACRKRLALAKQRLCSVS
jgi:hypothetical protein